MKIQKLSKTMLIVAGILFMRSSVCAYELTGPSFYGARSQSVNAARDLVGFCQFLNKANCGFEGMLVAVPAFQHSFKSSRIAQYFFNADEIRVTGSLVPDRLPNDLLADNFGLSPSFESTVAMAPHIKSALIDLDLYLSYNPWYIRIHAPICWSQWHYKLNECVNDDGTSTPFPALYMAQGQVQEPVNSFTESICGHRMWGDVQQGLQKSIICGPRSTHSIADLRVFLGWHILRDERYYVGINIIGAVPTGSHIHSAYFFEPVVGNGHHWELGVGLDGRVLAWECEGSHTLSLYGTVHATHMFRNHQQRSFDFCRNGFASRYLLLKEFNDGQYTGNLVTASTVTTLPCTVWIGGQFDIVAMLGYLSHGLEIDLGYNAWIRTHEHVNIRGTIAHNRYGIKGIQNVNNPDGSPNNLTQSTATIHGNELTAGEQAATADTASPVFIRTEDLNPHSGAATSAFSQKFFAHVGYAWSHYCHVNPYLGMGGEIEFEGDKQNYDRQANHNTAAQWGIWLKGGAIFD
jgi:hypothetical protein